MSAADRLQDVLSKYARRVAGPCTCEDGTCPACATYRAHRADLNALVTERDRLRGQVTELEEALRERIRECDCQRLNPPCAKCARLARALVADGRGGEPKPTECCPGGGCAACAAEAEWEPADLHVPHNQTDGASRGNS